MCEIMQPACAPACPGVEMCSAPPGYSAGVPTQCVVGDTSGGAMKGSGPCSCGQPTCCNKPSCCYVQPPRTQSFKPISTYTRPNIPIENCSIYKRSYCGIDPCMAKIARSSPIFPKGNLFSSNAKMENCTIQKLSYPPNCGISPAAPIKPPPCRLGGQGPMQTVTTQKHDYVPKPLCIRQPILQGSHMQKTTAPLEKTTINRLSYMPVDVKCFPPPKPFVPEYSIPRPDAPAENCTVYKLSYLPSCIGPKEEYPWAKQVRNCPPPYGDLGTIYKYSYLPNCKPGRVLPIRPCSAMKLGVGEAMDKNTTYKLSYFCPGGSKSTPILPKNALEIPTGPVEKCTVYKLSYLPNCNASRTMPIRPINNYQKSNVPMQSVTTQKHDFVPKPICRTTPFKRGDGIARPCAPMENKTINRLSYLPNMCYQPPKPIYPDSGFRPVSGPPENCTTYKLSYMPVCPVPKDSMPWANRTSYQRPTAPMETCTVQKLSYMPPGRFLDKCCCSCSCKQSQPTANMVFPKAAC